MSDLDHFAEAERLSRIAKDTLSDYTRNNGAAAEAAMQLMMWATANAQVHATLALAEAQEKAAVAGAQHLLDNWSYEGDLSVRVYGQVTTR